MLESRRKCFEKPPRALGYLKGPPEGEAAVTLCDPKDCIGEAVALDQPDQLVRQGEYAQAEELLRELVAANPGYLDTRLRLVLVLIHSGQVDAAIAEGRSCAAAVDRSLTGSTVLPAPIVPTARPLVV